MSSRWTEKDLANFEQNSGRPLSPAVKKAMAEANRKGMPLGTSKPRRGAAELEGNKLITPAEQKALAEQFIAKQQLPPAKKRKARKPAVPVPTAAPMHQGGAVFAHRGGHKYHAQATVVDGIRFDSKLESERYKELKLEVAAGKAAYFLRQVPFHLPGGIRYVVDFMIVYVTPMTVVPKQEGRPWCGRQPVWIEFEDCKGTDTPEGRNKIKQVFALYGVTVKLIKKAGDRRRRKPRK